MTELPEGFMTPDGEYTLASERDPATNAPPAGGSGTTFSWAPTLPLSEAVGDSGFLMYNVGDTIVFLRVDARATISSQPVILQLRERVACHHLHWSEAPAAAQAPSAARPELEALIGFSSGEMCLWRPLAQREAPRSALTTLLQREGELSPVCALQWRPVHAAGFAVAHGSGRLHVYERRATESPPSRDGQPSRGRSMRGSLRREASGAGANSSAAAAAASARHRPVACAQVSDSGAALHALAFDARGTRLATTSADALIVVYQLGDAPPSLNPLCRLQSYYGGVLCCCWSSDGLYLLTGGEDDFVSIWDLRRRAVVARGQGHDSWVSALAVDPLCDHPRRSTAAGSASAGSAAAGSAAGGTERYRFASVSADAQLKLWEFCEADLLPPPEHSAAARRSHAAEVVPAPPFRAVPLIRPHSGARLHTQPMSGLMLGKSALLTSCVSGHIRVWARPTAATS